ncbi:diguanylate cyclase [Halomonas sp. V046]|uniref:diguanylate cyclase n=1 Tax=Halomonas sp. V046 TaxID=3459611 RepID=UPI0040449118
MSRTAVAMTLTAAALALLGQAIEVPTLVSEGYRATLAFGVLLALGQCVWYWRGVRASLLFLLPLALLLALVSVTYVAPENLIGYATLDAKAASWVAGADINDLRPPLTELFALMALTASLLVRTRASLGAPLLQALALMMLISDAAMLATDTLVSPQNLAGNPATLTILALLLAAQFLGVMAGWRHSRASLVRSLVPALALAIIASLFWNYLRLQTDHQLYAETRLEYQRVAGRLSSEVAAHLSAMRRFASFWGLLGRAPRPAEWRRQAELYYQDFRYFLNIAFIDARGRIRYVYPHDRANRSTVGTNVLTIDRPYVAAVAEAIHAKQEGQTGVVPLLQGVPGIIHYLPMIGDGDELIGVSAMVVSLPMLAETLYQQSQLDRQRLSIGLRDGDQVIREWRVQGRPGPWEIRSDITIGKQTLQLVSRPNREYLLMQRSRQAPVSLAVGLTLAYLLYLVLFGNHRLAQQHSSVRRSNEELRREVRTRTHLQREVEWLAGHDELTGLPNRRLFLATLREQAATLPLSVLLCDIDHFKSINDRLGHQYGDHALARFAELGRDAMPPDAMFARYGGEEFIVLLPNRASASAAEIATTLRQTALASGIEHADGSPLSVSIGVATHDAGVLVQEDLLKRADAALYQAKRAGRNRVIVALEG